MSKHEHALERLAAKLALLGGVFCIACRIWWRKAMASGERGLMTGAAVMTGARFAFGKIVVVVVIVTMLEGVTRATL